MRLMVQLGRKDVIYVRNVGTFMGLEKLIATAVDNSIADQSMVVWLNRPRRDRSGGPLRWPGSLGESVEMTLNAIDDVHNPVSTQIQTTLSIATAEKLASQLHTALMIAPAHRTNR